MTKYKYNGDEYIKKFNYFAEKYIKINDNTYPIFYSDYL